MRRRGFLAALAGLFGGIFGGKAVASAAAPGKSLVDAGAAFEDNVYFVGRGFPIVGNKACLVSRRLALPPGATVWLESNGDGTFQLLGWHQGFAQASRAKGRPELPEG